MIRRFRWIAIALLAVVPSPAKAADTGAVANGNWSSAATWTNGVPGPNDDAYIGSGYPSGAATSAAVSLSQNSLAKNVYLGNGSGATGTLDLGGFGLTANNFYLGNIGGAGTVQRTGGGSLSIAFGMYQTTGNFTFAAADVVTQMYISNNSTAITSADVNIYNRAGIDPGSTLTLGADLTLKTIQGSGPGPGIPGTVDLGGTLNANGHAISASNVNLGLSGGPFTLVNRGPITGGLAVSSQFTPTQASFNLTPADAVTSFDLYGVTTSFPAGVGVQSLSLNSNGASPPTYATVTIGVGNTQNAAVGPGCTLTLTADLSFQLLTVDGTLNANGHAISGHDIFLGLRSGQFAILNRGPITTSDLQVSSISSPGPTTFNLTTADAVTALALYGVNTTLPAGVSVRSVYLDRSATAATSALGNVAATVIAMPGTTVRLGADLTLTGDLDLRGTLFANGYAISAQSVFYGYYGGPAVVQNDGLVTTGAWLQGASEHSQLSHPGDALGTLLLTQYSLMTVRDVAAQTIGLTIGNPSATDVTINPGSDLMLEVNGLASGWIFRWVNPSGGNHIANLQNFISAGEITFSYLNGGSYTLSSDGSYTYVNVIPVPEPSSLALVVLAAIGIARVRRRPCRDGEVVNHTLPEALLYVWQGYQ